MIKKRENGYVRIINEPAKTRIANNQCPSCGKPKSEWKRRKDWACCSPECTYNFESYCIIRHWPALREKCFERDNYTCKMCGVQPRSSYYYNKDNDWPLEKTVNYMKEYPRAYPLIEVDDDKNITYANPEKLIADHIKPIALGGEQWDIGNLQTLCIDCNKKKTQKDAAEIAVERRIDKKLVTGQKTLPGH